MGSIRIRNNVAGGCRLLCDALDLTDRHAGSAAGAGERDFELLLRLDVAVTGNSDFVAGGGEFPGHCPPHTILRQGGPVRRSC